MLSSLPVLGTHWPDSLSSFITKEEELGRGTIAAINIAFLLTTAAPREQFWCLFAYKQNYVSENRVLGVPHTSTGCPNFMGRVLNIKV